MTYETTIIALLFALVVIESVRLGFALISKLKKTGEKKEHKK